MIDLYAMGSPNVVKIYIALEEMGLPYTVHPVDVFGEEQFKPEFLRLNPVAKVPVIIDHDGPGGKSYTLFESGAILLYLAEKTSQLLRTTTVEEVNALVQKAAAGPLAGILGYEARPLVSADYTNDTRSSIFDGPSTMVTDGTLLKVYAWYDNEVGYACRMVDLANIVIERDA